MHTNNNINNNNTCNFITCPFLAVNDNVQRYAYLFMHICQTENLAKTCKMYVKIQSTTD